jgi:hypothetical protein
MNTIDFDQNRYFCEHLIDLLAKQEFRTFQCLLADHGHTLSDFIDLTIDALMPPPDLTTYYHAVQQYIVTGVMK